MNNFEKNLNAIAEAKAAESAESSKNKQQPGGGDDDQDSPDKGSDKSNGGQGKPASTLTDESVLKYISEKTNREIGTFDDLVVEKVVEKEVAYATEFAKKYDSFYRETGGSVDDFNFVQQDVDSKDDMELVRESLSIENPGMTRDDIDFMVKDEFLFNENIDDDNSKRKKEIAVKQKASKTKAMLKDRQEKFRVGKQQPIDENQVVEKINKQNKANFDSFSKEWSDDLSTIVKDFDGVDINVGDGFSFKFSSDEKLSRDTFETVADVSFTKFVEPFKDANGVVDKKALHEAMFKFKNFDKIMASGIEMALETGQEIQLKERVNPRSKNFSSSFSKTDSKDLTDTDKLKAKIRGAASRKTY